MGIVRPLTDADIPALPTIHVAAFGELGTTRELIDRAYQTKLRELVLDSPYADISSPSLVHEEDGEITGFVIVTSRPASFQGKRVAMATTTHLAVDPEARASLAAVRLLRAVTDGPQDLTYVDLSNAAGRKALLAAGYEQMPAYSLRWSRALRPAASIAGRVESRLPFNARFLVTASERVGPRLPGPIGRRATSTLPPRPGAMTSRPLTIDDVTEAGPRLMDEFELHPDFADRAFVEHEWKLVELACPSSTIVRNALTSRRGDIMAWYVAEIGRTGEQRADVLQFVAGPQHQGAAMISMLHDLYEHDVVDVEGDLPMRLLYDAEALGCSLYSDDATTSVHAGDDALVDAFRRNAAWFSVIEGELIDLPAAAAAR